MKPEQEATLERLYRTHFHALEVHAYRFLRNWDDAHVAAQETFHIACEKADALTAAPDSLKWLKSTTKHVCQNMRWTKQHQQMLFTSLEELGEQCQPAAVQPEDDGLELFSGLISEEELTLLQKIIVDGTSYADAAGELGISIWACRKRVQRAIDKLHKRCREKFGENFP